MKCVGVWVCGRVGVWACGRVGGWAGGRVGVWVCGCVGVWDVWTEWGKTVYLHCAPKEGKEEIKLYVQLTTMSGPQ